MKELILRNRHTLLLVTVVTYILLIVLEGIVTNRESRVYEFENPFFDLNLENIEEFESRRQQDRDNH